MATETTQMILRIEADVKAAQQNLKSLKAKIGGVGDQTKKTGTSIAAGMRSAQTAYFAAAAAATALVGAIGATVKAAQVQEDAEKKLGQAIKNTGDNSTTTLEGFKQFAAEIQKVTTMGDEATLEIMQMGLLPLPFIHLLRCLILLT